MSTTLTLTPHRRREPRRIRGIPTISAGHLDGGTANVSAVDTELPTGSNPRGLSGEAGRPHQGPSHLSPSDSCPALLVPAQPPGGGSTSALARPASGRPTPRGWGSTGRRLCVLHEPPPLVEYPQPSSSSTRTSCSRRPGQLTEPRQRQPHVDVDPRIRGADTWRPQASCWSAPLPPRARG